LFDIKLTQDEKQQLEEKGEFTLEDIHNYEYSPFDLDDGESEYMIINDVPDNIKQQIDEYINEEGVFLLEDDGWEE